MESYRLILSHVPPALLVISRIGGLVIFAPVFSAPVIPGRVKALLIVVLGVAVYPLLASRFDVGQGLEFELWALIPLLGLEILIGMLIGFVAAIPMTAVQLGGLTMGQQMGLGFARFYNPGIDDEADVVGQLLFFLALAGFLLLGGHDAMVLAVLRSFEHIPPGQFVVDGSVVTLLTGLLLSAMELALRIAAPVLALVFLESAAMGFLAKTVPQLNILSLGFPLRILMGIAMVMVGIVIINEVIIEYIEHVLETLFLWIDAKGG